MTPYGFMILSLSTFSHLRCTAGQIDLLSGLGRLFQTGSNDNQFSSFFQKPNGNQVANSLDSDPIGQTADKGKACIPYMSDLAKIFWGNCKQQADARTWLAWSKTIQDAFDGGKITLDNAVKETCRLTAEKETCDTMGQKLASCDVFGLIQTAVHMTQSQQRCEKIKGFIFQPQNEVQNAGQLVGNEIVGGFVRRFLFGQ